MKEWVEKQSEKLHVGIKYTQHLYRVLVNRAWHICKKMNESPPAWKGKFLEKEWNFAIQPDEFSITSLQHRKMSESRKNEQASQQLAYISIKKVSDTHTTTSSKFGTQGIFSNPHTPFEVPTCQELSTLAWLE